jgi:hypothetical protein
MAISSAMIMIAMSCACTRFGGGHSMQMIKYMIICIITLSMKNVKIWAKWIENIKLKNEQSLYARLMCIVATAKGVNKYEYLHEGTNLIGIDTLSTYCLTNDMSDFDPSTVREVHHKVTGMGGENRSVISHEGAGTFKLRDDNGTTRTLSVPELFYCSTVPYKIISPPY